MAHKLNFKEHTNTIYQTAVKKSEWPCNVIYLIAQYQRRLILNSLMKGKYLLTITMTID